MIVCDDCCAVLEFGDSMCYSCHKPYSQQYWDNLLNTVETGFEQDYVDGSEVYDLTICCTTPIDEPWLCECAKRITWNDVISIPRHVDEDVYEYTSKCSGCRFWYTPQCLPYRSWVKNFLESGAKEGHIDICSYYVPDIVSVRQ